MDSSFFVGLSIGTILGFTLCIAFIVMWGIRTNPSRGKMKGKVPIKISGEDKE